MIYLNRIIKLFFNWKDMDVLMEKQEIIGMFLISFSVVWLHILLYVFYRTSILNMIQRQKQRKEIVKKEEVKPPVEIKNKQMGIVGNTRTTFIDELPVNPVKEKEEVIYIDDLFMDDDTEVPFPVDDIPLDPNDIEFKTETIQATGLTPEEEAEINNFDYLPPDENLSTGITFEQMSAAMEVIKGNEAISDTEVSYIGPALIQMNGAEMFQFIMAQAEAAVKVEEIINRYVKIEMGLILDGSSE